VRWDGWSILCPLSPIQLIHAILYQIIVHPFIFKLYITDPWSSNIFSASLSTCKTSQTRHLEFWFPDLIIYSVCVGHVHEKKKQHFHQGIYYTIHCNRFSSVLNNFISPSHHHYIMSEANRLLYNLRNCVLQFGKHLGYTQQDHSGWMGGRVQVVPSMCLKIPYSLSFKFSRIFLTALSANILPQ
jgi:hypothetical protein